MEPMEKELHYFTNDIMKCSFFTNFFSQIDNFSKEEIDRLQYCKGKTTVVVTQFDDESLQA